MPETPKKFYLTTPIYYVNARPHIGHAYSTIAADVIARRHRLLGDDTFFLTGTDEHGQKVQRSAEKAGVPPQQFADEVSATFRNLWKRMGITNDDYIRTTDERHKRGVQKLWSDLEARGAIYLSTYTGQYSVGEEMFVEGPPGTIGPDGKPTETVTEENYFFKLSEYQERLINLIESGELHFQPETAKNEILSFLRGNVAGVVTGVYDRDWTDPENLTPAPLAAESRAEPVKVAEKEGTIKRSASGQFYVPGALKDLSISRTTFDWGIPVPGNPKHVIYVWLDALANYMTAVGYGSDDPADIAKFEHYWPADLHLVGKEITRQHCIYWPAFLMGLRPPEVPEAEWNARWLPKSVVANGWLLFEESKMSKSRGNVVRTETILDAFGPLCPPVPASEITAPGSLDSTGLQPGESAAKKEGALAPGTSLLAAPTKAQQDLFAADVLRYFLLREIPFGQDGSFSFDALITRYNADLANGYGNLVSRTLSMIAKYFAGSIPAPTTFDRDRLEGIVGGVLRALQNDETRNAFNEVLEETWGMLASTDAYITRIAPWKLAANPEKIDELADVLYNAAEFIRIYTALIYPFMPYATASVWRQLGLGDIEEAARNGELKNLQWGGLKPGTKLRVLAPIFPRADKGLAQIMTDMENPATPPANIIMLEPDAAPAPVAEAAAAPRTASLEPGTSTITIDDFAKVDLRVAQIVVAERIPKADKLLRIEVDLGTERRQILAGIAEYYAPETLIGRKVVIVANLAPRKMRGLESQGMIVAASIGPAGAPVLAGFLEDVELGARLK
jgi:methionyl-tRNA synthetase